MNENGEPEVGATSSTQSMVCPNCASPDVVKASVAYQMGTSTASYGSVGIGTSDGQLGVGLGRTRGQSTSQFAQRLKPPSSAPAELGYAFAVAFAVFVGIVWLFDPPAHNTNAFVLVLAPALAAGYYTHKAMAPQQRAERQTRLAQYERLWVCLRCGRTADRGAFTKPM